MTMSAAVCLRRMTGCLASTRLALALFAVLGLILAWRIGAGELPESPLVVTLCLLTVNLAMALAVHRPLRADRALLVFHLGLLAVLVLAAASRLTRLEGHVEVLVGSVFDAAQVNVDLAGPLHGGAIDHLMFEQGPFSVDYAPGVRRSSTRSRVRGPDDAQPGAAADWQQVGDDLPYRQRGFRFYTTHNKGYAAMLHWQPAQGEPIAGAIHMPSYPLFEWRQDNRWQPPGGPALRLWLQTDQPLREDSAWTLDSERFAGVLVVNDGNSRHELHPGDRLALAGGQLSLTGIRGWIGYRIHYDPMLYWLFGAASVAAAALGWRALRQLPALAGSNDRTSPVRAGTPATGGAGMPT